MLLYKQLFLVELWRTHFFILHPPAISLCLRNVHILLPPRIFIQYPTVHSGFRQNPSWSSAYKWPSLQLFGTLNVETYHLLGYIEKRCTAFD